MSTHSHENDHGQANEHHHDHSHKMSMYEFLGQIIAGPLDETLRFNVCDPDFWSGLRPKLSNPRTLGALAGIDRSVAILAAIPENERESKLNEEYALCFCGDAPLMPPCEDSYGMQASDVHAFAQKLGIASSLPDNLSDHHLASELLLLVPIDQGMQLGHEDLAELAQFFEEHPIALAQAMIDVNSGKTDPTSGFYRSIVKLALAWLRYDLDAFEQ